jgi:hypothetical protein
VWGKIGDYLDQALQMLLRAQEQYNEGIDGIGLTVLVRNPDVLTSQPTFVARPGSGLATSQSILQRRTHAVTHHLPDEGGVGGSHEMIATRGW